MLSPGREGGRGKGVDGLKSGQFDGQEEKSSTCIAFRWGPGWRTHLHDSHTQPCSCGIGLNFCWAFDVKVISFGQLAAVRNSVYCLCYQGSCRGKTVSLGVPLSLKASRGAGHRLQPVRAGEEHPGRWGVIHWAGVDLPAALGQVRGRAEVSSLSKWLSSLGKEREKLRTERGMCVNFHLKLETQGGIFLTHGWFWIKKKARCNHWIF